MKQKIKKICIIILMGLLLFPFLLVILIVSKTDDLLWRLTTNFEE